MHEAFAGMGQHPLLGRKPKRLIFKKEKKREIFGALA